MEVKSTDESVKNIQILSDLSLLDNSSPSPVYIDNCGAVDWSISFSSKGMRHVNIHANGIQEAWLLNEISIHHIPGVSNPADLFTKEFKSDTLFHTLHGLLLFYPSSFKMDSFSCLDGGIKFFIHGVTHIVA